MVYSPLVPENDRSVYKDFVHKTPPPSDYNLDSMMYEHWEVQAIYLYRMEPSRAASDRTETQVGVATHTLEVVCQPNSS